MVHCSARMLCTSRTSTVVRCQVSGPVTAVRNPSYSAVRRAATGAVSVLTGTYLARRTLVTKSVASGGVALVASGDRFTRFLFRVLWAPGESRWRGLGACSSSIAHPPLHLHGFIRTGWERRCAGAGDERLAP